MWLVTWYFSKVTCIIISHGTFSSILTLENFRTSGCLIGSVHVDSDMIFLKISSIVISHGTFSSRRTFENSYWKSGPSAFDWSEILESQIADSPKKSMLQCVCVAQILFWSVCCKFGRVSLLLHAVCTAVCCSTVYVAVCCSACCSAS